MRMLLSLLLLAPTAAAAGGPPTCADVPEVLYGIALGSMQDYPTGLREGLRNEGTAEVIADVGFKTIDGRVGEVAYPRIMAFFDRGSFTTVLAMGRIATEADLGFARIVEMVGAAANAKATVADGKATFACEGSFELSIEPTPWDDGPAVQVHTVDTEAHKRTSAYIAKYCADPQRRRPRDACRK